MFVSIGKEDLFFVYRDNVNLFLIFSNTASIFQRYSNRKFEFFCVKILASITDLIVVVQVSHCLPLHTFYEQSL